MNKIGREHVPMETDEPKKTYRHKRSGDMEANLSVHRNESILDRLPSKCFA